MTTLLYLMACLMSPAPLINLAESRAIKRLPERPEPLLLAKILNQVACLGRIHASKPVFSFS